MKKLSLYILGVVWCVNFAGNLFLWRAVKEIREGFPFEANATVIGVRLALMAMAAAMVMVCCGIYEKRVYRNMLICSVLMLQCSSIIYVFSLLVEFVMVVTMRWK